MNDLWVAGRLDARLLRHSLPDCPFADASTDPTLTRNAARDLSASESSPPAHAPRQEIAGPHLRRIAQYM